MCERSKWRALVLRVKDLLGHTPLLSSVNELLGTSHEGASHAPHTTPPKFVFVYDEVISEWWRLLYITGCVRRATWWRYLGSGLSSGHVVVSSPLHAQIPSDTRHG
jgi:hypothetical protein